SSQWKFLIHILLQSLSAKRTSWNEFSTAMASANQIGDLSTHTTSYISPVLTQKVFVNMRRVRKGFSGVETPLFEEDVANEAIPSTPTPLILPSPPSHDIPSISQEQSSPLQKPQSSPQALPQGAEFPTHLFQQVLDTCFALTRRIENLEHDKDAQKLDIIKLKARVKRLERANKGRMIDDLDKDERIELVVDQVKDADTAETEGRHAAEQAEIYHLDLDHPSKVLISAASTTISAAKLSISADALTVVVACTRRRKGVKPNEKKDQIELDVEYARKLHEEINKDHEEINKDIDWDAAIDHVKQKSKENPHYIKRYQVMKKRPQTESEARKNMMIYLKNTTGYKLDFFKGMSYDEIRPIFQARFDANMRFLFKSREEIEEEDQEVLKSINETPAQKAAKRRKLNEEAQEVEDLKKHLEVVNDEDDDVFTEVTPLARKVPVVDYQIV
nr:hypothetical protein [Tanacetum cinerariifolium]